MANHLLGVRDFISSLAPQVASQRRAIHSPAQNYLMMPPGHPAHSATSAARTAQASLHEDRFAEADLQQIVLAIRNNQTQRVQSLLAAQPGLSRDNLLGLASEAMRATADSGEIVLALINHAVEKNHQLQQAMLDLAIQHQRDDVIPHLLGAGADPHRCDPHVLASASDATRSLLRTEHRIQLLLGHKAHLPAQLAHLSVSEMAQRLRDKLAQARLHPADQNAVARAWASAIRSKDTELQLAILVHAAEGNPSLRAFEGAGARIDHPAVRELLAEVATYSPQQPNLVNTNCAIALFNPATREIEPVTCLHHVLTQQDVQRRNQGRIARDLLASSAGIRANVNLQNNEATRVNLRATALETHLIDPRQFGGFIAAQFAAMQSTLGHRKEAHRQIYILSLNHGMNLNLRIKEKDGKPSYVVWLADPNVSNNRIRTAFRDPMTVSLYDFKDYVENDARFEAYFPTNDRQLAMAFVMHADPGPECSPERSQDGPPRDTGLLTSSCLAPGTIDKNAVLFLLRDGFAGELIKLGEALRASSASPDQIVTLLTSTFSHESGTPAFFPMFGYGHVAAVDAFGTLLDMLPEDRRAGVLRHQDGQRRTCLDRLIENNSAVGIRLFAQALDHVPPGGRADIVAGVGNSLNTTAMHRVLKFATQETADAFASLLMRLGEKERADVINAKNPYGRNALHEALTQSDRSLYERAEAIKLCTTFVACLAPERQVELLGCGGNLQRLIESAEREPLPQALVDAVETLLCATDAATRSAVLRLPDAQGKPLLHTLLETGNTVPRSYAQWLRQMPEPDLLDLLTNTVDGRDLIATLIDKGGPAPVNHYLKLLDDFLSHTPPLLSASSRQSLLVSVTDSMRDERLAFINAETRERIDGIRQRLAIPVQV